MSLVDLNADTLLGTPHPYPGSAASTTSALSATNAGSGVGFAAPKTGTISDIGINASAVTGTPPTYRVGLEGVNATRTPSGTYKDSINGGAGSANAFVDKSSWSAGFQWCAIGNGGYAATVGDILAATIRYQTGTISAAACITQRWRISAGLGNFGPPWAALLSAGAWSNTASSIPEVAVRYSDGEVVPLTFASGGGTGDPSVNQATWNNAAAAYYRGIKWTPPVDCQLVGLAFVGVFSDDVIASLFVGAASSAAVSHTLIYLKEVATASAGLAIARLAPTTLTAGAVVRLVFNPNTATNVAAAAHLACDSIKAVRAILGFDGAMTTGTNASPPVWTDYDNGSDGFRAFPVFPIIRQVAGGGGVNRALLPAGLSALG